MKICSICQGEYEGYGNNARPVNKGRCCDECNRIVLGARVNRLYRKQPLQATWEEMEEANDAR